MSKVHQTFEAQAFHPDFGNEVVNGELSFIGWMLRFQAGDITLEIPFARLVTETEDGDERIFFTDPEQPELKVIAGPDLLNCHALPQVERIRQQLTARLTRRELSRRLKIVLYFLAACVVVAWVGTVTMKAMVRSVVNRVPPEWEAEMGSNVMAELKTDMVFVEDTNYVGALATLAEPLLRVMPGGPTNYTFHVVQEDEPNAFALPGGHIVVTTGLLNLADRPEELLAVIAHELAHVTKKHHLRKAITAGGPFLVFRMFVGRGGSMSMLAGVSALMIGQGFSQEYEAEADDVGWDYLLKANINPHGMIDMFRKLSAYQNNRMVLNIPQAFSSHPALEKRIRTLEAKWKKLPRKTGFIDFRAKAQQPR